MVRQVGAYIHRPVVDEVSAASVRAPDRPERHCGEVRRPADGGVCVGIPGIHGTAGELASEIEKELTVGREVALRGIDAAAKPLTGLEGVAASVPQRKAPPLRRTAPQNYGGFRIAG